MRSRLPKLDRVIAAHACVGGRSFRFQNSASDEKAVNDELQRLMGDTVWASGCKAWYANSQGKIVALYPRLLGQFRRENERVEEREYEMVRV